MSAPPADGGPYGKEPQLLRFRRRLRAAMRARRASSRALAREVGLARSSLTGYLTGLQLPSPPYLVRLSRALGVSTDWLLGFDCPPAAPRAPEPSSPRVPGTGEDDGGREGASRARCGDSPR